MSKQDPALSRTRRVLSALAVAGAVIGAGGAAAQAAPSSDDGPSRHEVSAQAASAADDYWTASRMENAVPADGLLAEGHQASTPKTPEASPTRIDGTTAQPEARSAVSDAAPGEVQPQSEQPVDHIGKIFFTLGGTDYVCSGNAVVSQNESTVATAGHCANEGPGDWATNWVFVPAYEDGAAPLGKWTAESLYAPTEWTQQGDITYDTAFAVVGTQSGQTLTDVVGASGVSFDENTGLTYTSYGYPAAAPFDGQSLESCHGAASPDPTSGTKSQGIPCDMTGGSSGGPWFVGSGSSGYQNSVNSFGYNNIADTMFGPYWGDVIKQSYDEAQSV